MKRAVIIISLVLSICLLMSAFGCQGTEKKKEVIPGVYYVRQAPYSQDLDAEPEYYEYSNLNSAKQYADENALYGCIVTDSNYDCIYAPYSEMASEILYQAKIVCDYIRDAKFKYGNAPINPAFNHDAKLVSCDRLVDWVLYRVGFVDQPYNNGKCVAGPGLTNWCIDQGFKKITKLKDCKPGDIIFMRPNDNGDPQHVYINASDMGIDNYAYRYDAGSDTRIQSTQPSYEINQLFMYAYRVTKKPKKVDPTPVVLSTFAPIQYTSVLRDDFDSSDLNWKAYNNITSFEAKDGVLSFESTGMDPYFLYNGKLDLKCSDIDCIRIRLKNGTPGDSLQIFFTTDTVTEYCQSASKWTDIKGLKMSMTNDSWDEITIDMTKCSQWKGTLTGLRIDPSTTTGKMKIDFISLDKIG